MSIGKVENLQRVFENLPVFMRQTLRFAQGGDKQKRHPDGHGVGQWRRFVVYYI